MRAVRVCFVAIIERFDSGASGFKDTRSTPFFGVAPGDFSRAWRVFSEQRAISLPFHGDSLDCESPSATQATSSPILFHQHPFFYPTYIRFKVD